MRNNIKCFPQKHCFQYEVHLYIFQKYWKKLDATLRKKLSLSLLRDHKLQQNNHFCCCLDLKQSKLPDDSINRWLEKIMIITEAMAEFSTSRQ